MLSRHGGLGTPGGGRDMAGHNHDTADRACYTAEEACDMRRSARAQPDQVRMLRYKVCIVSWLAPRSRYSRTSHDTTRHCVAIRRARGDTTEDSACDAAGPFARASGSRARGRAAKVCRDTSTARPCDTAAARHDTTPRCCDTAG